MKVVMQSSHNKQFSTAAQIAWWLRHAMTDRLRPWHGTKDTFALDRTMCLRTVHRKCDCTRATRESCMSHGRQGIARRPFEAAPQMVSIRSSVNSKRNGYRHFIDENNRYFTYDFFQQLDERSFHEERRLNQIGTFCHHICGRKYYAQQLKYNVATCVYD